MLIRNYVKRLSSVIKNAGFSGVVLVKEKEEMILQLAEGRLIEQMKPPIIQAPGLALPPGVRFLRRLLFVNWSRMDSYHSNQNLKMYWRIFSPYLMRQLPFITC